MGVEVGGWGGPHKASGTPVREKETTTPKRAGTGKNR